MDARRATSKLGNMRFAVLSFVVAVGFACTGKGPSTRASTDPGSSSVVDAPSGENVKFADVYRQTIAGGCTSGYCHGGGAGGLTMTDETSAYAALVDVPATTAVCGGTLRVSPGSADASILWHRVRPSAHGEKACATKMPGEAGLDGESARVVKAWIDGGAQR